MNLSFLTLIYCTLVFSQHQASKIPKPGSTLKYNEKKDTVKLSFTVEGSLPNLNKKKAVLHLGWLEPWEYHEFLKAEVVNGKFKFSGKISQPTTATLRIVTYNDSLKPEQKFPWDCDLIEFFLSPGKTTIIGKDSLTTAKLVTASRENEIFHSYIESLEPVTREIDSIKLVWRNAYEKKDTFNAKILDQVYLRVIEKKHRVYQSFILNHRTSYVSIIPLNFYTTEVSDKTSMSLALGLFNNLSSQLRSSPIGLAIKQRIEDKIYSLIGKPLQSLILENATGSWMDLTTYKGKILLIDFWASWCYPCKKEFPELLTLYDKYKSQGLEIIGISIDANKEEWRKGIQDNKLLWPQFVDSTSLKNAFYGKAGSMFRINNAVPTKFLINPQGIIVAKNLPLDQLELKIKDMLLTKTKSD